MKRLAALAPTLVACGSASVTGGFTVLPGTEPTGVEVRALHVGECRDASGGKVEGPEARVRLVRRIDGRHVLVQSREGYDTLVVDNGFPAEDGWVFQAVLEPSSAGPTLHEYRVPARGDGHLALARRFDRRNVEGGFFATYRRAALACVLVPDG